jgi:4'-phosphopantetheinyl transferase EntD
MLTELNQSALTEHFSKVCHEPLFLSVQHKLLNTGTFTEGETEKLSNISSEKRKAEYIQGRLALKEVLNRIGYDTDTSILSWPNTYCSLSHSEGYAVAVSSTTAKGLGLDLQLNKIPSLAMAERILSTQTLSYWQALPDEQKPQVLQRLWTVNEAVYKASPVPQPANFRHYMIDKPESMQCSVRVESNNYDCSVFSLELPKGFISIALR